MVFTPGAFIHGRVGELEVITAGWRFMQRTMNEEEKQGFNKMINMPGFCVKKFEEEFLLKRINPFAKNPQSRSITISHEDCPCGNSSHEGREVAEMKKMLSEFVVKWGDVLEKFTSAGVSQAAQLTTEIVQKADELQQKTEAKLQEMKKPVETLVAPAPTSVSATESLNAQNEKRESVTKLPKKKEQVAEQREHIANKSSDKEKSVLAEKEHVDQENAERVNEQEVDVTLSKNQSAQILNGKTETVESSAEIVQSTINSDHLSCEITKTSAESKAMLTVCEGETSSLPSPVSTVSPNNAENGRSVGTPDSGMISDISEFKTANKQVEEKKPIDPEKMTGRDGRRARKKREAEKLAMEQPKLEEKTDETPIVAPPEPNSTETGPKTGKEKRRLKDKLRREKKELEKLSPPPGVQAKQDEQPHNQPAEHPQHNPNEVSQLLENAGGELNTVASKEASKAKQEKLKKKGEATEKKEDPVDVVDDDDELAEEFTPENNERSAPLASEETFSSSEPTLQNEEQLQPRMSKGQKKRAKKKANKGVYVVNDRLHRAHSIELLPGEYTIVTIDQQEKLESHESRTPAQTTSEINIDDAIEESKQYETGQDRRPQNLILSGNISKNILDNGKWLAYVIDDNNPDGTPKIGEVSNDQVVKTIQHLDSQRRLKMSNQTVEKQQLETIEKLEKTTDKTVFPPTNSPVEGCAPKYSTLPELDADFVRKTFADLENPGGANTESSGGAGEALSANETLDELSADDPPEYDDLEIFLAACDESDWRKVGFRSDFAQKTAPLLVGNNEFKEFCSKYSSSKYDRRVITVLIRKYIDTRIVFHFERFKKLADRESHRISQCWTHVKESSAYALMVMLYINAPTTRVGFLEIENALFPRLCCSRAY